MSEFIAIRLLHQAANGDLAAIREIHDRVDGPWDKPKQGEAGKPGSGPMVIQICYEAPVVRQTSLQKKQEERSLTRAEKMLDVVRALPSSPDASGIVYEPIEPESAE
jgi:hypothetical protein